MKIYDVKQRSREWDRLRSLNFTASEIGAWAERPVCISITATQCKQELEKIGEPFKKSGSKDELMADLFKKGFDFSPYTGLTTAAKSAIIGKIEKRRIQALRDSAVHEKGKERLSAWDLQELEWADSIKAQEEKKMGYNIPVQRGIELEAEARVAYEAATNFEVEEVGFIEHDSGGFGCSPDGIINLDRGESMNWPGRGLEIKCPMPATHYEMLLMEDDGMNPEAIMGSDWWMQVQCSMAVTGLKTWDFFSYCPGMANIRLIIPRTELTDRLEEGMKILTHERKKMEQRLASIWDKKLAALATA